MLGLFPTVLFLGVWWEKGRLKEQEGRLNYQPFKSLGLVRERNSDLVVQLQVWPLRKSFSLLVVTDTGTEGVRHCSVSIPSLWALVACCFYWATLQDPCICVYATAFIFDIVEIFDTECLIPIMTKVATSIHFYYIYIYIIKDLSLLISVKNSLIYYLM